MWGAPENRMRTTVFLAVFAVCGYADWIAKENTMPLTTLTMKAGRSAGQKKELLDAVHGALLDAFSIPKTDRNQYINEIAPDNWDMLGGQDKIIVEIKAFAGRSLDAKRKLYKTVVENLTACGVLPEDVFIVINDVPMENWGIRGGQAACDVDMGFKIDV